MKRVYIVTTIFFLTLITFVIDIVNINATTFYNGASRYTISETGIRSRCEAASGYKNVLCMADTKWRKGVRYTMVYYDGNSYTNLGHFDLWNINLWFDTSYPYYIGSSRVDGTTSVKHGDYVYFTSYGDYYTLPDNVASGYLFYDINIETDASFRSTGQFTTIYDVNFTFKNKQNNEYTLNKIINDGIISKSGEVFNVFPSVTLTTIFQAEKDGKHMSSDKCASESICKGYRIFVEPLYQYDFIEDSSKNKGVATAVYILTPSEAARLVNTGNYVSPITSKGTREKTFETFAQFQKSIELYTTYDDVGITAGSNASIGYEAYAKEALLNTKYGVALNIIDVSETFSCDEIEEKYNLSTKCYVREEKKLSDMTLAEINSLDATKMKLNFPNWPYITYDNSSKFGWTITDYTNNCIKDAPSCDSAIKYYKENTSAKVDLSKLTVSQIKEIKNNVFVSVDKNATWNSTDYISNCCKEGYVKDPKTCKDIGAEPEIPLPICTPIFGETELNNGDCEGNQVSYEEENNEKDFWNNCVFNDNGTYDIGVHKQANKAASLTYYEKDLGSQYCEVYCVEDFDTSLMNSNVIVKAGTHFTWNNHTIKGSRNCRTKEIQWDDFINDLDNANDQVRQTYVNWQLEVLKRQSIASASVETDSSSCSCIYNTAHNSCCSSEDAVFIPASCTYWYVCGKSTDSKGNTTTYYCHAEEDCSYYTYPCSSPNDLRYDLYEADGVSYKITQGERASWGGTSWCSNESTPSTNVNGYYLTYRNAISNRDGILNNMESCYTWDSNTLYNLNPNMTLSYQDGGGVYSYFGDLEANQASSTSDNSSCKIVKVDKTECIGTNCPAKGVEMKECQYVDKTKSTRVEYNLNNDLFRYVLKDGQSFSGDGVSGMGPSTTISDLKEYYDTFGGNFSYFDIGYGNLPVSYKTKAGTYNNLSLTFSNLGHRGKLDAILNSHDTYGNYSCPYTVTNGIIQNDNDKGLDVVYRTISLTEPFPGMSGDGRYPGNNWTYDSEIDYKNLYDYTTVSGNDLVDRYIINNRGVESDQVYKIEPMYTFELNPTVIKAIREYNDSNEYADFDLDCTNGKKCISDFLTDIIDNNYGNVKATGTCINDRYTSFDTCRYEG